MYPRSQLQQGSLRGPYAPDNRYGQGNEQPSYAPSSSRPFDLPRPLEPQPNHHTSNSYSESSQRNYDSYSRIGNGPPESRSSGPNLPGVRALLHPAPTESNSTSYASPWTPSNVPPTSRSTSEAFFPQSGSHPPLAPPPPSEHRGYAHESEPRRIELPILDTTRVERNPAPPPPASPYIYAEPPREYMEVHHERPRQASTSSYSVANVTSPYTPGSAAENFHRAPPPFERNGSVSQAVAPEVQRKYLGIHEIPGEGTCHVYEGGYRTPTHVDGEFVNPQWGLTKANKPRKRLALACLDCREKKIKCEPGQNACLQCEKTKRVCRRCVDRY